MVVGLSIAMVTAAAAAATAHGLAAAVAPFQVTDRWGGPLGITRDWYASCGLDRHTGLAWAGGYVGDGVGTSNLGGRTLADLITGTTIVTSASVALSSAR